MYGYYHYWLLVSCLSLVSKEQLQQNNLGIDLGVNCKTHTDLINSGCVWVLSLLITGIVSIAGIERTVATKQVIQFISIYAFVTLGRMIDILQMIFWWFPSKRSVMRSFDVFFDLRLNKRPSKQSRRRWFETPSLSLCRHYNDTYQGWCSRKRYRGQGQMITSHSVCGR